MSCCDGCRIEIENFIFRSATITAIEVTLGELSGMSPGDEIAANTTFVGHAKAVDHSKGEAAGVLTVRAGDDLFRLPYKLTPKNKLGHCPCKPSVEGPASTGGKTYAALSKTSAGNSKGAAWIRWSLWPAKMDVR